METPFKNLLILGDHIHLMHNALYMEKVATVAKMAVNKILAEEGVPGGNITILDSETPDLWVKMVRKLVSVEA